MKKFSLCSALLMSTAIVGHAQVANNTSLVGTITDPTGSVVAGAKVIGTNRDTKVAYTGTTNAEGYYSIPFINPGTYDVTVDMTGFKKVTASNVVVTVNLAVRTDVTLSIGSDTSEVSVSAQTSTLSTDDAMLGETVDQEKVHDLPINGRQALSLAQTASNITVSGTALTGNPPGNNASGAGTRGVNNSITLDGVSIMNNLGSTATLVPNPDALSAVQVQNGNYTAQYGDYLGVHINQVSASGTNKIHGTVYDYIQNDALNAKSWLSTSATKKPTSRYNQFGGVVSGPIFIPHFFDGRNKAFFLASYEGLRDTFSTFTIGTVLTDRMRTGDFGELGNQLVDPYTKKPYLNNIITEAINPVSSKVLPYLTRANLPGATNNFQGNLNNVVNSNSTLDRIDYNIGENVRLFARFDWQSVFNEADSINYAGNNYGPTVSKNGAAGYTHIITPNLVNDLRVGSNIVVTRNINYFDQNNIQGAGSALGIPGFTSDVTAANPGLPTINITNYQGTGGEDGTNWFQDDRTLTGYDQLSYTRGKHSFMAGVSLRKLTIGRAAVNGARGTFTFASTYTGDPAADFYLGTFSSGNTPYTQVKGEVAQWRDGFFAQDTWLVSQKLTVQYGLRYELPQVAYSKNGVGRILTPDMTALFPAQGGTLASNAATYPNFGFTAPNHDNIAPRLGFSYRVTNTAVIRGGGGIYYNANHLNAFTLSTSNFPYSNSVSISNPGAGFVPTNTFSNPGAGAVGPVLGTPNTYVNAFTVDYHLQTPRMYQWNVDLGQEVWKNGGLEFQYLGSHSIHLDESYYPNQPQPGAGNVNARRPNQLIGQIRDIRNDGIATYNGLTVVLRQRTVYGLSANLSYTWSHSLDTSPDSNGGGTAMYQGHLKLDYGNSNGDIKNRFVGTVTYALPKISGHNLAVREALGGWQVNAIVDLRTGTPINVSLGSDVANAGNIGTQRPNYVHAERTTCSRQTVLSGGTHASCLDASAYAIPANFTYGNARRNATYGPGAANTNLSLFKDFAIHDGVQFQIRAEAFNAFNHPNPALVPTGSTTSSSTTLPSDLSAATLAKSSFGDITAAQTGFTTSGARILQIAGKINF
ncbi:TonB-dependent receptor [Granulicella sp. WH15]|uniref:TonB-dependent receptor n=1 Tax=Granulicella sp. WH15 TaxID=2602070 RepID=UPI00136691E2|nr:carboxypeptidase regulatory-like domain-containing protein [Granulicella sp. WH15]QHN03222.1 TonB-dependent receptor [Granulicella sp. WH15]